MRLDSPSVMTTLAWWSSRSCRLTAVVCSGRNRPQDSNGQWLAMPRARRFVGGGDEPEQQLGAGVVQGCEADLVDLSGHPHKSTYADPGIMPTRRLRSRGIPCVDGLLTSWASSWSA